MSHNSFITGKQIGETWLNSIPGSVRISEGIHLAEKETNFGEWDVCDINCIILSKICEKISRGPHELELF